ncbi:MAG: cellulose synthase subunit BcsC-related outer membrane protein [Verrucomicrobiota bacterium]
MSTVAVHRRWLNRLALLLFSATSLGSQDFEEQGLFPTSMEEILVTGQPSGTPTRAPVQGQTPQPTYFLPDAPPAERSVPQTVVPTQQPRSQPLNQEGIPTQVLLPTPEPVAEPIQSPTTPTIVFSDTQTGLVDDTIVAEIGIDPGQLLADKQYDELEPWVLENQDVGMASAIGWSYYTEENYPKAIEWFEQTLRWDENFNEAAYGLALSLYNEGFLQQAEAVARWKLNAYPGMDNILGDIYMTRAISSFRAERYDETLDNLDKIVQFRPLTRGEEILEAWSFYHTGETVKAAGLFQTLYEEQRDRVAAVGLYASLSSTQNWNRIERLANQYGGPLADIYALYTSDRYYDRRLYLKASQVATQIPDADQPFIENIAAPKVTISAEFVARDGDPGTSELDLAYAPYVTGTVFSDEVNRVDVSIGLVSLDAGQLPDFAFVGLVPNTPTPYSVEPKTSFNGMIAPMIGYYREDWISPYIELGMTPLGGQVDSEFVGRLGVQGIFETGVWTAELFRESITESLLSYTGFRDPYTSLEWGRVVETGLHASILHFFGANQDLSLFGFMEVGQLTGENVADNEKIRLDVALNRTFKPDGFHYINFGPSFTFYSYTNNLSFFTFGHGGYFSPEYLAQGIINLQFMTEEGEDFLLKGEVGFGGQANEQEAAPFFPLDPDGRDYSGTSDTTGILISNLQGVMFLTDYWAFGGEIAFNKTPSYEEFRGGVFTTIFFEPREGLVETDFPRYQY